MRRLGFEPNSGQQRHHYTPGIAPPTLTRETTSKVGGPDASPLARGRFNLAGTAKPRGGRAHALIALGSSLDCEEFAIPN
jgi:hypothetical protein